MNSFRFTYGNLDGSGSTVSGVWHGPYDESWNCPVTVINERILTQALIYFTDSDIQGIRAFWEFDSTDLTALGPFSSIIGDSDVISTLSDFTAITFSATSVYYGFSGTQSDVAITSLTALGYDPACVAEANDTTDPDADTSTDSETTDPDADTTDPDADGTDPGSETGESTAEDGSGSEENADADSDADDSG